MLPPDIGSATIVSCDVFDTLLHRDRRSEAHRFRDIARLASARLSAERGASLSPNVIWRARTDVQQHAYKALSLADPSGDVRFADLIDAMASLLALDAAGAAILHEAEIAVERRQLAANRPLLSWLAAAQTRTGCRIIAVSDTYHRAETIAGLLDALAPGHPVAAIHTSADHGATKRSGALFEKVLRAEGARAGDTLHIGDDHLADVAMARAAGLPAWRLERPRHVRITRMVDAARTRALRGLQSVAASVVGPRDRFA